MQHHQDELLAPAVLGLQDFTRLLFNFLRVSPDYWLVGQHSGTIRLHRHMDEDQRSPVGSSQRVR